MIYFHSILSVCLSDVLVTWVYLDYLVGKELVILLFIRVVMIFVMFCLVLSFTASVCIGILNLNVSISECNIYVYLTLLSLVSFLWDIGKQYSPRCDAAERGIPSGAILFA